MKQKFSLRCLCATILLLCASPTRAYDFGVDGIFYNIIDTISNACEVTYPSQWGYSGDIIIPDSVSVGTETYYVTAIGDWAFLSSSNLTSVTMGDGITSIGFCAFHSCTGLTGELTLPNSVTSIGKNAFYRCFSLTGVTIPNSVTKIEDDTFYYCSSLTELTIPNSVTTIGDRAFYWCSSLTELTIPNSVTTIGDYAFYGCGSMTQATIGAGVTSVGQAAFASCSKMTDINVSEDNQYYCDVDGVLFSTDMTTLVAFPLASPLLPSYTIPDGVKTIGDYAFSRCSSLTELTIPNSVTTIGDYAFYYCSDLTGELKLPDSVTTIGNSAFDYCSDLTGELTISNSVTTIGNYAFYSCSGLTSLTLDAHTIGSGAFRYCRGLTSITIGENVALINEETFRNCRALTAFVVAEENQCYCAVDGVLFSKDKTTLVAFPLDSPPLAFIHHPLWSNDNRWLCLW